MRSIATRTATASRTRLMATLGISLRRVWAIAAHYHQRPEGDRRSRDEPGRYADCPREDQAEGAGDLGRPD